MAFAIVHFTVGFVAVLAVLSLLPLTRYRLTGAYLGGIWALVPDAWRLDAAGLGRWLHALHDSPRAEVFFFHRTLDAPAYRAHNLELTFLSLLVLGVAFVVHDRRFGSGRTILRRLRGRDVSERFP